MEDLGEPIAYIAIRPGVPVYGPGGEHLGTLEHVLADQRSDVFDGLVVDTSPLPGGRRFADADDVEALYDRGVVLRVGKDALHELSASSGVLSADPGEGPESPLQAKLRRAWDLISGRG